MFNYKLNIIKYRLRKGFVLISLICVSGAFAFLNCTDIAPTIHPAPSTELSPPENLNTLYPSIQSVYPGKLQTLDVPQSYPTDVNTSAADIVVVFSHEMENDNNELSNIFFLYEDFSTTPMDISIYPDTSSKYFIITPVPHSFSRDTYYSLYVYKFANVNDEIDRILEFDSLVELPASTLSPANTDYVEFLFRTGSTDDSDLQPPSILTTNPGNGEKNVDPGLAPGGYIEIVFLDNVVPMIDPSTVNIDTVILEEVTVNPAGTQLDINPVLDETDSDFKTFRIYPLDALSNGTNYRVTISAGNTIEDFQGNSVNETIIFFDTAPTP